MSASFIFVCQQGELEIKALLLAASLVQNLRGDYELIAAVPHAIEKLDPETLALLTRLRVRLEPIQNPLAADYPIGNKLACLDIETQGKWRVFLDSDMLCLTPINVLDFFKKNALYAKPADAFTLGKAIDWQAVYQKFSLVLPSRRFQASVTGETMLPYFNAGFIAVPPAWDFAKTWINTAQAIDADTNISNKRPWLDQMALPIALAVGKHDYHCIDERFNYPAHLKPLNQAVFFCHYHYPHVISREPRLQHTLDRLLAKYPSLKKRIENFDTWQTVLDAYRPQNSLAFFRRKRSEPVLREMVITGIPRSGTSYLCQLLHKIKDAVAINEPLEIFEPLAQMDTPWALPLYYRELRRDILAGKAIENKIKDGQLIEDTAVVDQRQRYHPKVKDPNFLLATKNTLSYLNRLEAIKQVMPSAPIIACVRHPIDTIASWANSFPHLKEAKVEDFPIGHPQDPHLSPWQRQQIQAISKEPNLTIKRALLWDYLARLLLRQQEGVYLLRYEKLVNTPFRQLHEITDRLATPFALKPSEEITASTVRSKRDSLSDADHHAVIDICAESAAALGYDLSQ